MDKVKKLLGKRIKELRKSKGMSQERLSELVDIDQRTLSHIECGDTFPSQSLVKLANALDATLPELFDFEHCGTDIDYMKKYISENLENLKENDIKIIYRLIKSMR